MIIVDTNVIAYLFLEGPHSNDSRNLLKYDSSWAAPVLWKSEFRNVLATYIRNNLTTLRIAQYLMNVAEDFLHGNEFEVNSNEVLALAESSGCSAYDCEFVALAKLLGQKLYTSDKKLLKAFPDFTVNIRNLN